MRCTFFLKVTVLRLFVFNYYYFFKSVTKYNFEHHTSEPSKLNMMDEIFRDFLVTFIIVAAIFGIVYVYFLTRHRERMKMMEQGIDLSEITSAKKGWIALKYGMFGIGLAIGFLVGNILYEYFDMNDIISFSSMSFLFGGISLVGYFLIETKYRK